MDQIKDGQKYIFVYEAAPVAMADMAGASAAVTLANGEVTADMNKVMPFVLGKSGSYYTFTNGDNQLGAVQTGGSGSSATWGPTAGGYNVTWIITNVNGAVDGYTVRNFEKDRYMKVATYDNTFILSTSSTAPYAYLYVEKTDEPVLEDLTGEITIGDPDVNGHVTVAYKGDEDVTLSVKVKDAQGNEVDDFTFVDGVVTLPDYGTYTVEVTATAAGYNDLTADKKVTWTKPVVPAPVPTLSWDPDTYTMTASCDGHQVVLMINNEAVSNPYTVAQTTEDQTIEFSAYTVANADESGNSDPAKPLMKLTGKITFSVTQGNKNNPEAGIVTATYDGNETGVTVKIVGDPTKVAAATSEGVQLPDYGTYQVKAVATAEGYADLEEEGVVTWDEPQTAAPEFNVSQDGLTVEATGEGTVKLYIVNADGSETEIDNPTTFVQENEARTVNLKAVAHVDGAKDGVATTSIVIPAKSSEPGTGVNELVDGKAVKSVRYFNMAGQEMQEVNGVTIVVTTYTDGTTSAVKVMK